MTIPPISVSDVAAFLALAVAIWSGMQTGRFNRRQNDFAQTAERLNNLVIAREATDAEQQRKADVSANFIHVGKGDYRLKVFNRGACSARNVRLEVLAGDDLFGAKELSEKFPFSVMERQQHVDVVVFVTLGTPRRAHLRLTWDDDSGDGHASEIWRDVF